MKYLLLFTMIFCSTAGFAEEGCTIKRAKKPVQFCKRGKTDKFWAPAVLIGGGAGAIIAAMQPAAEHVELAAADLITFTVALDSTDQSTTVVQVRIPSGAILDAIQLEGIGAQTGSFQIKNPLEGTYIMRLIQATGDFTTLTGEIIVDEVVVVPAQEFTLPPPSEITTTLVAP